METKITVKEVIKGKIISFGTGYNGQDDHFSHYSIEGRVNKNGFSIHLGMRTSEGSATTYCCYDVFYPNGSADSTSWKTVDAWKEKLSKYCYSVNTHGEIISAYSDVRAKCSVMYKLLKERKLLD